MHKKTKSQLRDLENRPDVVVLDRPALKRVGGGYGCGTLYHAGTSRGAACYDDTHFVPDEE